MARPPLPVGTYGKIKVYELGTDRFRARAKYRDYDGVTRPVERVGASRTAATNKLKEALRDRGRAATDGEITPDTTVTAVGELWLRDIDDSNRAIGTKALYRRVWNSRLVPAVGALRLRDMRVSRVDRVLRDIVAHHGTGTGTHAKVILSGLFSLAVRMDAIDSNPVRDITLSPGKNKREKIVLSADGASQLHAHLRASTEAKKHDLVDLVAVLAGLGCRIGELLALDWSKIDVDRRTIAIEGTVIRVPAGGILVQAHTKSRAGMRTITPPAWVLELLQRRHADSHGPWVFPSTRGAPRDPSTVRRSLAVVLRGTDWQGLHPHAFRHLVATQLDAAGLTAREIADYLGHEQVSMTQDVYMSRRATSSAAAASLPPLF